MPPATQALRNGRSMKKMISAGASLLLFAGHAAGQSASAALSASETTVAPGETVRVELLVTFDAGSVAPGPFGDSGLFGFAGTVEATGPAAADLNADAVAIDPRLGFATVGRTAAAPSVVTTGGGTGLSNAIAFSPATGFAFDLTIDPEASGSVDLAFDGAVVLVVGDDLVTFATTPGANQSTLSVSGVTLTVADDRLCADQNGDGLVTPADFNGWILNFNAGDQRADTNQDGSVTPADFNGWILAFNQGVNGPTCTP